ncbi:hypothetical protein BD769DRAFT_52572 [Suillus cothurnatus]|nr:hypothetical protein BD769DRAFT_52572 [Suillus cothurnatus]
MMVVVLGAELNKVSVLGLRTFKRSSTSPACRWSITLGATRRPLVTSLHSHEVSIALNPWLMLMIFSGRRAPIAFVFNDHVLEMILLCNNGSTRSCGLITVSILRTCCRTPVHSGRVPRVPTRAIHNAYYKPGRVVRVSCTRSMDSSHRDFFTQAHLSYRCLQRCDNHRPKYILMRLIHDFFLRLSPPCISSEFKRAAVTHGVTLPSTRPMMTTTRRSESSTHCF